MVRRLLAWWREVRSRGAASRSRFVDEKLGIVGGKILQRGRLVDYERDSERPRPYR